MHHIGSRSPSPGPGPVYGPHVQPFMILALGIFDAFVWLTAITSIV